MSDMSGSRCTFERRLNMIEVSLTEGEPLSLHTSFKTGGKAKYFITVKNAKALHYLLRAARDYSIPVMPLGCGSNILASDKGYDGVVVSMQETFCDISVSGSRIRCGAGVKLNRLCTVALENSLTGLEFAYGIPGTVGGAVFMNAGAYNGEIKDVLSAVTVTSAETEREVISASELDLSYRHSIFCDDSSRIITEAEFILEPGDRSEISAKMLDLMERRRAKQPIEYPSAGSTFKRPVDGYAGTLIEECGLKGFGVGAAQVSEKHAGFIINTDTRHCTSSDIFSLIKQVQKKVYDEKGVLLVPEVRFVGEF